MRALSRMVLACFVEHFDVTDIMRARNVADREA